MTADIDIKITFIIRIVIINFNDLSILNLNFMPDLTNYLMVSTWERVW